MERYDTVALIGTGLLGASLGLALKQRGLVGTVRGVGHRESTLAQAKAVGAVDEAYLEAGRACEGASLVVICTPAALVPEKLDQIRDACASETIVTDVASTKAAICRHARETWPAPLRFVGSHPMAGSEKYGPEHATPALYEGSVTIVEPPAQHAPEAHRAVCDLWRTVGSTVLEFDPVRHDQIVACTSHVPHILAACLALLAADKGDVRAMAGKGFRDTTRVAAGRPSIWRDICLTNQDAIGEGLDEIARLLEHVARLIAQGDWAGLEAFFASAQSAREKVLGE